MNFFLTSAGITAKRMLRRRGTWLLLLLLPLLCVALCVFWRLEQPMIRVRVGVAFDPANEFHSALYESMVERDTPVEFLAFRPEERDEVERLVQTGRLECAYLFHENLTARSVADADLDALTLLKSPQSVLDLYFTEILFSALYEHSGWEMDLRLITELLGLDREEAAALLEDRIAHYRADEALSLQPIFELETPTGEGFGETGVRAGGGRIVHGMVALFLLAMTAYTLPPLIGEKGALFGRLDAGGTRGYLLGTGAGLFAVGFGLGLVTLLLSGLVYRPVLGAPLLELAGLAAYQFSLSAAGLVVVALLRRSDAVYGGAVFLVLLTTVLGGVLIDISELSAVLGGLSRLFLSSHYLAAVLNGTAGGLGILCAVGGVCVAAALALSGRRRRKPARL